MSELVKLSSVRSQQGEHAFTKYYCNGLRLTHRQRQPLTSGPVGRRSAVVVGPRGRSSHVDTAVDPLTKPPGFKTRSFHVAEDVVVCGGGRRSWWTRRRFRRPTSSETGRRRAARRHRRLADDTRTHEVTVSGRLNSAAPVHDVRDRRTSTGHDCSVMLLMMLPSTFPRPFPVADLHSSAAIVFFIVRLILFLTQRFFAMNDF